MVIIGIEIIRQGFLVYLSQLLQSFLVHSGGSHHLCHIHGGIIQIILFVQMRSQFLLPLCIYIRRVQIISPIFVEKPAAKSITLLIGGSLGQQLLQIGDTCFFFCTVSLTVPDNSVNLTKQHICTLIIISCAKQTGKNNCHENQNNLSHSAICIISAKIKVFQKPTAFFEKLLQVLGIKTCPISKPSNRNQSSSF